jgi:hypothetical protein
VRSPGDGDSSLGIKLNRLAIEPNGNIASQVSLQFDFACLGCLDACGSEQGLGIGFGQRLYLCLRQPSGDGCGDHRLGECRVTLAGLGGQGFVLVGNG